MVGFDEGDLLNTTVDDHLARLEDSRILPRIWARDHTVWRHDPTEISNRLGWLDLPHTMRAHLDDLAQLAAAVHEDGVSDLVLLGMGGSSLGSEALRAVFGPQPERPRLHVLDSTVPGWVRSVQSAVDPAQTLFIVASKSGTTAEVRALFDTFWGDAARHLDRPGRAFVAITDPESPLAALADDRGFRRCFVNPPDIGGRFSVLSFFGLVPAALAGFDVEGLLDSAATAASQCGPEVAVRDNPAARLGAFFAAMADMGRPLPTLLSSPRVAAVGLWIEQLMAESTGKLGRGVLPVTGEPLSTAVEGSGRCWVSLALDDDPAPELEPVLAGLRAEGAPLVERRLSRPTDVGGEMFIWELATAVAGHLLDVQPFDQPNVQAAKAGCDEALAAFERDGALAPVEAPSDLMPGLEAAGLRYVAILGYLAPEAGLEAATSELRVAISRQYGVPTTFGYGPRYLHSTGQLHKGGFPGGLFVQLVEARPTDLDIPGRSYGFATLARAQADGDLRALQAAGRSVVRIALGASGAADLRAVAESVSA